MAKLFSGAALLMLASLPALSQQPEMDRIKLHVGRFEAERSWWTYQGRQHLGIENLSNSTIGSIHIECGYYGEGRYADGNGQTFGPVAPGETLWVIMVGTDISPIDRARCEIDGSAV